MERDGFAIYAMCLYPRLIRNPKYKPNRKNNYNPPTPADKRVMFVAIGCGQCIECRKKKAREWQVRMTEELKRKDLRPLFITLTFDNQSLADIANDINERNINLIATRAMRLFLERYRKKYNHSLRHWFVTELGQNSTERIHMHGIVWLPISEYNNTNEYWHTLWKYGNTYVGPFCTAKTINYIVKYMMKIDEKHKDYKPIVLCSAGIGKNYTNSNAAILNRYTGKDTKDYYLLNNGSKIAQPIYYRNKLYSEEEREKLWLYKLDEGKTWVRGIECNLLNNKGIQYYMRLLKQQQELNKMLGYGDDGNEWKTKDYNLTLKMLNKKSK